MTDTVVPGAGEARPSSWIDRLTERLENLPGPAWVFYLFALGMGMLLGNAAFWIDGSMTFGAFDRGASLFVFYGIWWISLYHYLTGHASRALETFRPLLELTDSAIQDLDLELRTLPRNWGSLALILGIVLGISEFTGDLSASIGPLAEQIQTVLPQGFFTVVGIFFIACFFALVFRSIRQLRLVSRLHEQATNIDLFSLGPAHAFSGLTGRTGLGLILLLILISIPAPWETTASFSVSAFDVFAYAGLAVLAIVVFAVPLEGMRDRLIREKKQALAEVEALYLTASNRLFGDVRDEHYEDMTNTKDALRALLDHHDRLDKVSTWPWNPGTIRGFSSALLLPIFLLLVAQFIERLF
jgi:hypothetical protein